MHSFRDEARGFLLSDLDPSTIDHHSSADAELVRETARCRCLQAVSAEKDFHTASVTGVAATPPFYLPPSMSHAQHVHFLRSTPSISTSQTPNVSGPFAAASYGYSWMSENAMKSALLEVSTLFASDDFRPLEDCISEPQARHRVTVSGRIRTTSDANKRGEMGSMHAGPERPSWAPKPEARAASETARAFEMNQVPRSHRWGRCMWLVNVSTATIHDICSHSS